MSRRNLTLLLATMVVATVCYARNCRNPKARMVAEALQEIDTHALDRPADTELMGAAVRGMVGVLRARGDEHSRYLPPRAAGLLREEISGDFGGVGVRFKMLGEPPVLTVVGPPEPGSPAAAGGVRAGDRIVAVDGEPLAGWDDNQVRDAIRGPVGEPVVLSIERGRQDDDAEALRVKLTRAVITVPSVVGDRREPTGEWRHRLEQDDRVALVRITGFGDRTTQELRALLPDLIDDGVKALVLDLRGNPGGPLETAVQVAELFLPRGKLVVETRGLNGESFYSGGGPYLGVPLAVIVDRGSASASEIVSAALQDHDRAVVVGERSYGKGTVQRLIPLAPSEAMLKLTAASFWRPGGANIHRWPDMGDDDTWGVSPNDGFEVPLTKDERKAYFTARANRDLLVDDEAEKQADEPFVDPVLDRAVEHLQSLLPAATPTAPSQDTAKRAA